MPLSLNIKQRQAALLLAQGTTRNATAKQVGIDPATLSKWRQNPAFNAHIDSLLQDQEVTTIQSLYALKTKAIDKLSELLNSPSPTVAMRAVEAVLARTLSMPYLGVPQKTDGPQLDFVEQYLKTIKTETWEEDTEDA